MPITLYNDGSKYGDADAIYGRIGAELLTASQQKVRETALRVKVIDEQLNDWALVAGSHLYADGLGWGLYRPLNASLPAYDIGYWSYRGGVGMVKLGNGNIYRVRNGDPSTGSDRQLWDQTITDPTVASQWTTWAVLYSGTHYGQPVVVSDGTATGKIVYHAKSDGIYRNNVKQWEPAATNSQKALQWVPIIGQPDAGWVIVIGKDPNDSRRFVDYFYTRDLTTITPVYDQTVNHSYMRPFQSAIKLTDNRIARLITSSLHFDPRDPDHGISLWMMFQNSLTDQTVTAPLIIKGLGGGAGKNYLSNLQIHLLADGYYYLFGQEVHQDQGVQGVTSLGYAMPVWMRSKNLKHWSEAVVGPPLDHGWGGPGIVEHGNGYLYYCDTEIVYRRPTAKIEHEISNYIPSLEFELPRDNQPGLGTAVVANPNGVNDLLQSLSDREIRIEPGLRVATGGYEYAQFDKFFIKQINKEVEGKANRLNVEFGNIWDRLDTEMRDVTNFVGQLDWNDFDTGRKNQPFNYFFVSDTAPSVTANNRLKTKRIVLLTAWKGHNPDITARFSASTGTPELIFRYQNSKNYLLLRKNGTTLSLISKVDNTETVIDTWSGVPSSNNVKLRLQVRFSAYRVWIDDVEFSHANQFVSSWAIKKPGYVGFNATSYEVSQVKVTDWEAAITTEDLVRTALAMGDFHDVIVSGADSRAYALVWGPQTDNPTPAEALRTALTAEKLQLIWRNGMVEVGRFNDQTPAKVIQDRIIESDQIDEAKRRINIASVDGNEHFWIEVDTADALLRDRMLTGYFDLPELLDQDAVTRRAREEIKRSAQGASPGGRTPLFFDLWRMDAVTWIDNLGNSKTVRIEGFQVEINQSDTPSQRQTFDTSEYSQSSSDGMMDDGTYAE